jgi:hypothetical protein
VSPWEKARPMENGSYICTKRKISTDSKKEARQIKVRYKLVMAYAYYRMRKYLPFFGYMLHSVFISPIMTLKYFRKR